MQIFPARRRCPSSTKKSGRSWRRRLHKTFMKGTDRTKQPIIYHHSSMAYVACYSINKK